MNKAVTLVLLCLAIGLIGVSAVCLAAERKDLKKIDLDALSSELQKSAEPSDGMNLVWWVPPEFWRASMAQSKEADDGIEEVMKVMDKCVVIAVVRADISALGAFKFHGKDAVAKALTVTRADKDGNLTTLELQTELDDDMSNMLALVSSVLKNAMGGLGSNFHLFVYKGLDGKGNRIASPYEEGKLIVKLAKLSKEAGGTIEFETPVDALYVPRECTACKKKAHIRWNFCPWCGKALPE